MADYASGPRNGNEYLSTEEIGSGLPAAAVRDMIHLHPRHRSKERGEQMLSAAIA